MTDNNLIPFTKELWETGEYEALEYDIPVVIHEIFNGDVYYRKIVAGVAKACITELRYNYLMLRKKTKKEWHPVSKNTLGFATKEKCEKFYKHYPDFIKAIEVEI